MIIITIYNPLHQETEPMHDGGGQIGRYTILCWVHWTEEGIRNNIFMENRNKILKYFVMFLRFIYEI